MKKCINQQLGSEIALEISFNIAQRKGICLTPEQSQHLVRCESCNQSLPLLFKKGEAARETGRAYAIVNLADTGDGRVMKKRIKSGTALFKPQEDNPSQGVLVKISLEGIISDAEDIPLEEFNHLE